MSNVTVIRRSEQTDVTGKLVIENILEEMKEAGPSNRPGTGSLVLFDNLKMRKMIGVPMVSSFFS